MWEKDGCITAYITAYAEFLLGLFAECSIDLQLVMSKALIGFTATLASNLS